MALNNGQEKELSVYLWRVKTNRVDLILNLEYIRRHVLCTHDVHVHNTCRLWNSFDVMSSMCILCFFSTATDTYTRACMWHAHGFHYAHYCKLHYITIQHISSHYNTSHHITSQHIAAQHHITLEYIFCSLLTALVLSGATPLPHVGSVLITFTSHSGAARVAPESFILCEKERHL